MSVIFAGRKLLAIAGLGFASLVFGQTPPAQTPPAQPPSAQPPYPTQPQNRVVNPQRDRAIDDTGRRRCDELKGLEKSECERRDTTDDDAPAGMTPAMREKEEKARAEREAASTTTAADPRSDTAGERKPNTPPSSNTSNANAAQSEKEESPPKPSENESDTDSDSLDRPRG